MLTIFEHDLKTKRLLQSALYSRGVFQQLLFSA